jgi:hypothetical protein
MFNYLLPLAALSIIFYTIAHIQKVNKKHFSIYLFLSIFGLGVNAKFVVSEFGFIGLWVLWFLIFGVAFIL